MAKLDIRDHFEDLKQSDYYIDKQKNILVVTTSAPTASYQALFFTLDDLNDEIEKLNIDRDTSFIMKKTLVLIKEIGAKLKFRDCQITFPNLEYFTKNLPSKAGNSTTEYLSKLRSSCIESYLLNTATAQKNGVSYTRNSDMEDIVNNYKNKKNEKIK